MEDDDLAVARRVDVEFQRVGAVGEALREGDERVFWSERRAAAMREEERSLVREKRAL